MIATLHLRLPGVKKKTFKISLALHVPEWFETFGIVIYEFQEEPMIVEKNSFSAGNSSSYNYFFIHGFFYWTFEISNTGAFLLSSGNLQNWTTLTIHLICVRKSLLRAFGDYFASFFVIPKVLNSRSNKHTYSPWGICIFGPYWQSMGYAWVDLRNAFC